MNYLYNMSEFFETIKWRDFIDIFILAFILYRCFVLFWGTLVFRAVIGISLLWLFNLIVSILGLVVTSLILKGLSAIIVIVAIVVFRNEIRGVISNTNLLSLFIGKPRRRRISDYKLISDAIFALAVKRVGAILVFPRKNSIEHLIQNGILIRAVFSKELIFSIFDNKSPLHDGAVVMDGNQIRIAAVFLPLTTQPSLPLYYGTRHRAALGLSERSDAVIVVVSEERGEVSLVKEGSIKKVLNSENLSSSMEDLLEKDVKKVKSNNHKSHFVQDISVKIAFLILALIIWLFFAGEKESIISHTLPIEFRNLPKNLELLKTSADKAEVQISGGRRILLQLKPEEVRLSLNLEKSESGENTFSLSSKNLSIPPGLNISKINPNEVTVVMEEKKSKSVPIEPEWVGNLPQGKKVLSYHVIPDQVTIIGAPSVIKDVSSIKTEPISLLDIKESGILDVGIIILPASVKLSPDSTNRVKVEVVIGDSVEKPQVKKKQKK